MADGLLLDGDKAFREEIEHLAARVQQRFGIERTRIGWHIRNPRWQHEEVGA